MFRKRQLICGDLQWLSPPLAHSRPRHPVPPSSAPREHAGLKRPAESSVTTEGGQAAEAAGPGAAPVQVTEGLQADGTCGDSTVIRRDISGRNEAKGHQVNDKLDGAATPKLGIKASHSSTRCK